jgi:plastocyanin
MYCKHFFLALALTTPSFAANHDILAGEAGLSFTPNTTTAAVGDTLTFHFYPGRHNVVQGSFDAPCNFTSDAFYSGFIAPLVGESDQVFTVTVNDTNPIWYYCSEWMHCQLGMVGVVNPP